MAYQVKFIPDEILEQLDIDWSLLATPEPGGKRLQVVAMDIRSVERSASASNKEELRVFNPAAWISRGLIKIEVTIRSIVVLVAK